MLAGIAATHLGTPWRSRVASRSSTIDGYSPIEALLTKQRSLTRTMSIERIGGSANSLTASDNSAGSPSASAR